MLTVEEEKENKEIANKYKQMLANSYRVLSKEDKVMIRKAFDLALDAHNGQRRKSGEPYIHHPLEVAKIVADEIGLGATSISAALLHDVVEDTEYTLEDIDKQFPALTSIINGLTKISVIKNQEVSLQSENYRKLLLTLSNDIRVILIKIADRLHNMRTLGMVPERKQRKTSSETLFIYAPLAHRLGLYSIKTELENLSLKYTEPDVYNDIKKSLEDSREDREKYIKTFINKLKIRLDEENDIEYEIKGRPKSIFSINNKMVKQGIPFNQVFDLFAIRIIYDAKTNKEEKFMAWKVFSIVTNVFKPNPKRLRDWISQPKTTGYESLHTTVMGQQGKWVEVQIRSKRMDEIAERGVAAHYKYKENYNSDGSNVDAWVAQVREFLENNSNENTKDFIDSFKLNLYTKEIYVFTPKGDLRSLPKNSTALDFAYEIHSKVGDKCLGAKVNGKLVPLSHELQSGDQVEIITSEQQKPKLSWLNFVVTSRAKSKIKSSLNSEKREISINGKEVLNRKLRYLRVNMTDNTVNTMVNFFKEKSSQDLFYKVGTGVIGNAEIKKFVEKRSGNIYTFLKRFRRKTPLKIETKKEDTENLDLIVFGRDEEKLDYQFGDCCSPIAGDKVFGFTTLNKGIKVHKNNCPNAVSLRANYAYRTLEAKWINSKKLEVFYAIIYIEGIDRANLIKEISDKLSKLKVEIRGISMDSDNGIFKGKLSLIVKNKKQLNEVVTAFGLIDGVKKVERK